jgi:hypothetical protein
MFLRCVGSYKSHTASHPRGTAFLSHKRIRWSWNPVVRPLKLGPTVWPFSIARVKIKNILPLFYAM